MTTHSIKFALMAIASKPLVFKGGEWRSGKIPVHDEVVAEMRKRALIDEKGGLTDKGREEAK
jgi:hypothetical protein